MNEFYNKMKYFEDTEGIPAETYYHYTTLDALYNIVSNRTFWLTSLKSSNDKKEFYYKATDFLKEFSGLCEIEQNSETKEYFQLIKESIGTHEKEFYNTFKEKVIPYALCLCEKKDNLTHWDRYARGCTGVCIGFNISALKIHMQRMNSTVFGIGLYDVEKIFYTEEPRIRYIRSRILFLLNQVRKNMKSEDFVELIRDHGYVYAASVCSQLMKFSKNNSFIDEDEVRLYHDSVAIKEAFRLMELIETNIEVELYKNIKKNLHELIKQWHLEEEKFYLSGHGIRGYKELCLEEVWGSGVIPEIILGPMCLQNKSELRRFLKANGLEGTKITDSKVPIR